MQIYLARNNQQAGPYSLEQINQMLASQQVLLTDLAWHQGMSEWKALGELTQGKLVYSPENSSATTAPFASHPTQTQSNNEQQSNTTAASNRTWPNTSAQQNKPGAAQQELASLGSRFFAKLIDLALWIPALFIPAFFIDPNQLGALSSLQEKMQAATTSTQAMQVQQELMHLIPTEAWQTMFIYIIAMLAGQAFLLAKTGQSVGKRFLKIKIIDAQNPEPVGLTRIFLIRSVIFIILNMLFMPFSTVIDCVFALNAKRQTLHDKLAKTIVVKQ